MSCSLFAMLGGDGTPINEDFRPSFRTETTYWVVRDDYKAFLQATGEWPVSRECLLSSWFGEISFKPATRRENELVRHMQHVIRDMIRTGAENPTYKEVWRYLEQHADELEWIDEMTSDRLYWVTLQGKRNSISYNSFRNSVGKAKEEFATTNG